MNRLIENNVITELVYGNNLEYVINNQVPFLETDYKVLQNQSNDGFLKCVKITRNGQTSLCYLGENYTSLDVMMQSMKSETAISIAADILGIIKKVKENGFLTCQSIDLEKRKIFVDRNTMQVKMMYIPIEKKLYIDVEDFEHNLKELICELLNSVSAMPSEQLAAILADIQAGLPMELIYQKCREIVPAAQTQTTNINQTMPSSAGMSGNLNCLKLIACDSPYPFELKISEEDVLIGKKAELVDKVIDFNSAISRRHCRVIRQNGVFYVMDEGSANGTYVNGVRVEVGQRMPLNPGDTLKLANSDFRVE